MKTQVSKLEAKLTATEEAKQAKQVRPCPALPCPALRRYVCISHQGGNGGGKRSKTQSTKAKRGQDRKERAAQAAAAAAAAATEEGRG